MYYNFFKTKMRSYAHSIFQPALFTYECVLASSHVFNWSSTASFFFNVWHSVLPDSHIIIYSTNPILLSIFTIVNNAKMNMLAVEHLYYSPMMNFLKENCWSILTNRLPKTSCQFMFPPIKSSSVPYLDCRQPFFSLQQQ